MSRQILIAALALTATAALADDELEVTMQVIDNYADIDEYVVSMREPAADASALTLDDDALNAEESNSEVSAEDFAEDFREPIADGFEFDPVLDQLNNALNAYNDLDEGENVDEDVFDEPMND